MSRNALLIATFSIVTAACTPTDIDNSIQNGEIHLKNGGAIRKVKLTKARDTAALEGQGFRVLVRESNYAIIAGPIGKMPASSERPDEKDYVRRVVEIATPDQATYQRLLDQGIDFINEGGREGDTSLATAFDGEIDDVKRQGLRVTLLSSNLNIAAAAAGAGLFHTYQEIGDELRALADSHPDIARLESMGKSLEGRELWVLKISDNVNATEAEPEALFMGAHHAREWISVDVPFLFAKYLVENYGEIPEVTERVNSSQIWVAPMINPDGHEFSVTTNRFWRKNRRPLGSNIFGIDINRNYEFQWGGAGASDVPTNDAYRGTAPASEPETQAVQSFVRNHNLSSVISYHSYSQLINYPWSYDYLNVGGEDQNDLETISVTMQQKIRAVANHNYKPQPGHSLYLASGESCDWIYSSKKIPCFTIELAPNTYPQAGLSGFVLPESEIEPTFQDNLPAAMYLLGWSKQQRPSASQVSAATYTESAFAPGTLIMAFGSNLAPSTQSAPSTGAYPTTLGGLQISVIGGNGNEALAPIAFASPYAVTYQLPYQDTGLASVIFRRAGQTDLVLPVRVASASPAFFTAEGTGRGLALGESIVTRSFPRNETHTPLASPNQTTGKYTANVVNLSGIGPSDNLYLDLYATGVRWPGLFVAPLSICGSTVQPQIVSNLADSNYRGIDTVRIDLTAIARTQGACSPAGRTTIRLTADLVTSLPVEVELR